MYFGRRPARSIGLKLCPACAPGFSIGAHKSYLVHGRGPIVSYVCCQLLCHCPVAIQHEIDRQLYNWAVIEQVAGLGGLKMIDSRSMRGTRLV